MHSSWMRIQNVFSYFTTVLFALGACIAVSDLLAARDPIVNSLKFTNLQVVRGRPHYYSSKHAEYAVIKFSLDADLSSLFTWNTKEVFVYVTAEWPSSTASLNTTTNQAVIWDTIITAPSSDYLANYGPAKRKRLAKSAAGKPIDPSRGKLSLKNEPPKYKISHPSGKIASTEDVTLRLHYDVQPWVGVLMRNRDVDVGRWKKLEGGVSKTFTLPALKKKAEGKKASA
ncbi:putative signal peptidase [Podospora conica]|nr:putative signal peptidase [Schizothecium conicum]